MVPYGSSHMFSHACVLLAWAYYKTLSVAALIDSLKCELDGS